MGWFSKGPKTSDRLLQDAETRFLEALQREIANLLVQRDLDLMVQCYDRAATFEWEMAQNAERAKAEEAALTAKFPFFSDFDLIGTRHFVPYADAGSMHSDEDLAERYQEISRMLIFMRRRNSFSSTSCYNEEDKKVFNKVMQRERDTRFRKRIEEAVLRFHTYAQGLRDGNPSGVGVGNYDAADISVVHLPRGIENTLGVTF